MPAEIEKKEDNNTSLDVNRYVENWKKKKGFPHHHLRNWVKRDQRIFYL